MLSCWPGGAGSEIVSLGVYGVYGVLDINRLTIGFELDFAQP